MSGFADLVLAAQPAIADDGAKAEGTEGADWLFEVRDIVDSNGDLIDLSATTGVCQIVNRLGGTVMTTLSYGGFADGRFQVSKSAAATAGLLGASTPRGNWLWSLVITDTVSGKKVPWWIPAKSEFTVQRSA